MSNHDLRMELRGGWNGDQAEHIRDMSSRVHHINEANGWTGTARTFGDEIALLHSEVSEALEEFREYGTGRFFNDPMIVDGVIHPGRSDIHKDDPYPTGAKPLGVPSEAADILIRLLDFCRRYDIDLSAEFEAKLAYNATRSYRHGGKAL